MAIRKIREKAKTHARRHASPICSARPNGHVKANGAPSWGKRLGAALVLTLALIVALPAIAKAVEAAETLSSPLITLGLQWAQQGEEPDLAELVSSYGAGSVSAGFTEEAIDLSGYSQVYASANGGVVTCTSQASAEESFSSLSRKLLEKGWIAASSGSDVSGAFTKSEGAYQWLFASCTQFEGYSSIVFQCQIREESE